ncbi:ubx [Purpureocillium lavendulum]|uniref:Ubx n=1 Tax=Purpureocillium lavendulum TaxID=1247861 RepID=A0AB34G0E8_9HYPO|nr:ubx [Purpureocillium lavendulum]
MEPHLEPAARTVPVLPVELVLHIVDSVAPSNPDTIVPPSDDVTKTLLSLSRVCRATYPAASKRLRQHCVYIESNDRARRFARYLGGPLFDHSGSMARVHHLAQITQMFLAPFSDEPRERSRSTIRRDFGEEASSDHSWELTAPSPLDLPTALAVRDIFRALAPYLRRLVIDMPLRSLYPDQDRYRVRPVLRSAFQALVNLEEFTSVQDELFLNAYSLGHGEPLVWLHCWKKLRRLCIYNPDIGSQQPVWDGMVLHPTLEVAIFARADMNDITEEDMAYGTVDIKKAWFNSRSRISDIDPAKRERAEKRFTMVLVDCGGLHPTLQTFAHGWSRLDPENRIQVMLCDAPDSDGSDGFQNPIALTQTYLRVNAVRGSLFDEKAMDMRQAIDHGSEASGIGASASDAQ